MTSGTAAVTLGSLIAASRAAGSQLRDQTVTFLGAGSAGCGIAEQIIAQMKSEGLSEDEARARVFMVDRFGLLTDKLPNLLDFQSKLVQKSDNRRLGNRQRRHLAAGRGAQRQADHSDRGVRPAGAVYRRADPRNAQALRTPYRDAAVQPDLARGSPSGRHHQLDRRRRPVATGSPFAPVSYKEELYPIAQCNNSYIFPGIGLGVLASGATRVTDAMLMAASRALADCSPLATDGHGALLPNIDDIQGVSKCIAMEVGKAAQLQGVAIVTSEDALSKAIEHNFWRPQYRSYKRTSF